MGTITRIVQQKDKTRANVYLDGKFAFGILLEEMLKRGLRVGRELSLNEVEQIKGQDQIGKVYGYSLRFATARPRSEKEIKLWFKRKKIEENTTVAVFEKLKKLELADDLKFARWWVGQREEFRPKSPAALKSELLQKGVAREIIDEVLVSVVQGEEELARRVLEKKMARFHKLPRDEKRQKITGMLARNGFSWEVIRKLVDEAIVE